MKHVLGQLTAGALVIAVTGCATKIEGHSAQSAAVGAPAGAQSGSSPAGAQSGPATSAATPGAPGPDGAAHPCALLPLAEAEALAGAKLMAGTEAGQGADKTLCQYVGLPSGPLAQVQILVGDGAKKGLDIDRTILKHPFTSLAGIGDEAYGESDTVFLRSGQTWVEVSLVLLNDPAQNVTRVLTAARQVAQRLN